MQVSEAVKAIRKARKWTQARLARELGRSTTAVANWEQGNNEPRAAECAHLAQLAPEGELRNFFAELAGDYNVQPVPAIEGRLGVIEQRLNLLERMLESRLLGIETRIQEALAGMSQHQPGAVSTNIPGVTIHNPPASKGGKKAGDIESRVARIEAVLAKIEATQAILLGSAPTRSKRLPPRELPIMRTGEGRS